MKWIGQHIYDQISRFRNDVYLEDIPASTETDMLVVDSTGKVSKRAIDAITVDVSDFLTDGADNRVVTANGTDALLAETYLLFASSGGDSRLQVISSEDANDYFDIVTTTNGATTLTTVDGGAAAAHFEIAADGNITLDAAVDIVLEAGGNDITMDTDDVIITSGELNSARLQLISTIPGAAMEQERPSARLEFIKDRDGSDGEDGDETGVISFEGGNDARQQVTFSQIQTKIKDATDGAEAGDFNIKVAAYDGVLTNGLYLDGDTNADGEVDVTIASGAASVTTVAGTLTMGSTAFVNNSGVVQVATQGTIDHDSLANFVTAEHVDWAGASAGTIHSTNIPTLNQNTTGTAATVTGAAQTNITSLGTLTALDVDNININGDTITASGDLAIVATGNDITVDTDNFVISSVTNAKPLFEIKSTHHGLNGGTLQFTKDKGYAGGDGDDIGTILFKADDAAQAQTDFASIKAEVSEADDTDEAGKLTFSVAESDGTTTALTAGLVIEGEHATDGQVDVTIAAGAASTTTIAGTLTMGSTATLNNSGQIQVASQPSITTLAGLTSLGAAGATTDIAAGDVTMYNAVNDGAPTISIGSSATERLEITALYANGTQQVSQALFKTYTGSSTSNRGRFVFSADEATILQIWDAGLNLSAGKALQINGTAIISDSSGTATLSNIDALDATTEATIEAAMDTLPNVTSLGTLTNLDVDNININGDTITASADLAIVATGNDITVDTDNLVIESSNTTDPTITLKTGGNAGSTLEFISDKGGVGVDGEAIGTIKFIGDDTAQVQTQFARIVGSVSESADSDEAGKLEFFVAESDGTNTNQNTIGLLIEGEHATDGQIDVTIAAGAASTTTIAGDLTVTSDLTVNGDNILFQSANANDPIVTIKNTSNAVNDMASLNFVKDKDGGTAAQNDTLAEIYFSGEDASGNTQEYG